jgi:hypothetical protein
MAALLLNDAPVLVATITAPRVGVWVADLEVAAETAPAGRVTLTPETGAPWSGTVIAGGLHAGTWRGRVVGGAGGLRGELPATSYRAGTLQDVLADAVREAGETLAAGVDLSAWAVALYVRLARTAARTVSDAARDAGVPWRVTRAGAVWAGAETWPSLTLADVSVVGEDARQRRYDLAGGVLGIDPGVAVTLPLDAGPTAVQVDSVVHCVEGDEVTSTVWGGP